MRPTRSSAALPNSAISNPTTGNSETVNSATPVPATLSSVTPVSATASGVASNDTAPAPNAPALNATDAAAPRVSGRASAWRVRWARLMLAGALLWLGCFFGLGAAGIFDLDEGLYATVARQMVESGDWIVPRVGGEIFFDKPPLFYWAEALSAKVWGFTPWAMRLPSALASALTALLLLWWCARRGKPRAGAIAATLFLFCPLSFVLARQAVLDSLLTLWLTLAVIAWSEASVAVGARKQRFYLLMAVASGLAVMTKGVIGALLPGAALGLWLLLRRERAEARRVPWLPMALIVAAFVAPWHALMWRATGPEFVRQYIVHNHVQRFLGQDFAHNAPFWSYLPVIAIGLFPWSVLVPLSWWRAWQSRRIAARHLESAWALWALWAAVVILFFSVSRSKLPSYIQPATPALCLLVAARLDALWAARASLARAEAAVVGAVGVALGALLSGAGTLGWMWRGHAVVFAGKDLAPKTLVALQVLAPTLFGAGAVLLAGCGWMAWNRTKIPTVFAAGTGTGALLLATLAGVGLPAWNALDIAPLHDLARLTQPALERGQILVLFNSKPRRPSVRFVLGHPSQIVETPSPAVLRASLQSAGGGWVIAPRAQSLPILPFEVRQEAARGNWTLWRCQPVR